MERLIIEGDKKYLETIMRENRLRVSKYGLKMFFEKPKQAQARKAGSSKTGTSKK